MKDIYYNENEEELMYNTEDICDDDELASFECNCGEQGNKPNCKKEYEKGYKKGYEKGFCDGCKKGYEKGYEKAKQEVLDFINKRNKCCCRKCKCCCRKCNCCR
ncbi:hypothetical protein [Clostridium uliginosum]|uniref:Essential protein Yae1, N terminal n=1 Tax=Clostridium uliginosum TaxID=119641 RepID=A0A1I1J5I7_9CLOT|nr:hypothetical protein [Clostridium uliginosum]SFC43655.1 hypothetical protein SAMN05421842_103196 [Clostridium uliginosum]